DTLMTSFLRGKEIYDQFSEILQKQFTISGQSIDHWARHFHITIPNELNTMECQKLDLRLMELWQEASFYFAVAQAKSQLMKRGIDSNYLTKFASLTQEYKEQGIKLPAA